jgi:hypothetical protein
MYNLCLEELGATYEGCYFRPGGLGMACYSQDKLVQAVQHPVNTPVYLVVPWFPTMEPPTYTWRAGWAFEGILKLNKARQPKASAGVSEGVISGLKTAMTSGDLGLPPP